MTHDDTPTPRTDAIHQKYITAAFARQLERELTTVTEQRDLIEGMYQKVIAAVLECDPIPACKRENDQLEPHWEVITRIREQRDEALSDLEFRRDLYKLQSQQLTAVTEQRNRLAEALQKLADCDWVITLPDRMDAVREIANEALQSLDKPTEQ